MNPSRRSGGGESENAWTKALACARAEGRALLDITVSNPTTAGIPYDEARVLGALADRRVLSYEPSPFGAREAREAVARALATGGTPVPMERLVLTASTSEAYAFVLKLLCDPGDDVLAPRPSYPLLDELVRLEGASIAPYRLAWDGDWHVDRATVRPSDRTRAVIAVSPNNPTGSLLARDDLAHLASLGVPVIVDEVFLGYPLEAAGGAPTAFSRENDVLVLGGLSKLAGLPQMKLGWIAVGGSDEFAGEALAGLERIADAYLSLGTPAQVAAAEWLDASAVTRDAIRSRTRANLERLRRALTSAPAVTVPRVDAGWYACLRLPRTLDDEAWALRALERGVMVQPGYFYDFDEDGWLVVSLLAEEDAFREGIERVLAMTEGD